jgi:phage-related protein
VKRDVGYQLDRVQHGMQPDDSGAYRVIFTARLADAVYVLHAFQKKTQATSKRDIELAKQRFNLLNRK